MPTDDYLGGMKPEKWMRDASSLAHDAREAGDMALFKRIIDLACARVDREVAEEKSRKNKRLLSENNQGGKVSALEEVLQALAQAGEKCGEMIGVIQNGQKMTGEVTQILQNGVGNTGAYGELAAMVESVSMKLGESAQATEQLIQMIQQSSARFQSAGQ